MKVLEDHQQRLSPRDCRNQRGNCLEEPVPPALGIGFDRFVDDGHPAGQRRDELRQFPYAIHIGQLPLQHGRRTLAGVPLERFDKRLLRHESLLIAPPQQHIPLSSNRTRELHHEPGFSDARLSGDERQLAAAGHRTLPGGAEQPPLLLAPRHHDLVCSHRRYSGRRRQRPGRILFPNRRNPGTCDGVERGQHFAGALVPARRVARKTTFDDASQRRIYVRRYRCRRFSKDGGKQLREVRTPERPSPRRQLLQQYAKGPDVAARVGWGSTQLFRRRSVRCSSAERALCQAFRSALMPTRQPEVDDLDPAPLEDQNVGSFQVSVDNLTIVGVGHRTGDLDGHVQRERCRRGPLGDHIAQRPAIDELHHDERVIAVLRHLVHGTDIRMVQRAGRARLIEQAPAAVKLVARMEQLDGNGTLQPGVVGAMDDAHATRAEVVF